MFSRISGEDDNLKSLNRLLDRKLIFLIPSPYGEKKSWDIPVAKLRDGETLLRVKKWLLPSFLTYKEFLQAAERILSEHIEITPAATFYGQAPRKFYKYKYPKPVMEKEGAIGAKVCSEHSTVVLGQARSLSDVHIQSGTTPPSEGHAACEGLPLAQPRWTRYSLQNLRLS